MKNLNFDSAIDPLIEREGGFINHPLDRGGPTKYGITLKTLETFRKHPVTVEDVKNLTKEEAKEVYRELYWNAMKLNLVTMKRLSHILFDQGVNGGTGTAIKVLQEVLNKEFGERLVTDGQIGPKTEAAIFRAAKSKLCRKLIEAFQIRYVRICVKDPTQLVFLEGWLNRTFFLHDDPKS